MDELSAAVDGHANVDADLYALGDGELLDRTAAPVRARNRLDAELARTVRVAVNRQSSEHDGLKTMPSWLRGHARLSPSAAGRVVRNGRALEHLPGLAAAFAAGDVTADQVTVVAPVTAEERRAAALAQGVDLAEIDAVLTEIATTRQHGHLAQVVQHYLARLDPDGIEPDPTEGRSLTIAHRLSTAERADEVLVVEAGRVVQRGTHAELVDADGPYARLHASWRRSSTGEPAPVV